MSINIARCAAATAMAAGCLAVAACGSDSSSNDEAGKSGGDAGEASSGAQEQAKQAVARLSQTPAPIKLPKLSKPVPKGKTIAITTCPLPVCKTSSDASVAAVKMLGWTPRVFNNPLTPEGYQAAFDQILQAKPDGIAYIATLPNAVVAKQLAKVKEAGIPTVAVAPPPVDQPSKAGPMRAAYVGVPSFEQVGRVMGQVVVADGGAAKAVFVTDPNLGVWKPTEEAVTTQVEAAGGSVEVLEVPFPTIGKGSPGQIVSYLQAHPDVKYLVMAADDYLTGLPPALKSADLAGKVKLVGRAPQPANLAALKSGDQFASVADENSAGGWRAIDGIARLIVGDDISQCCFKPAGSVQVLTKSNVTDTSKPYNTPGVPESFASAWGVPGS